MGLLQLTSGEMQLKPSAPGGHGKEACPLSVTRRPGESLPTSHRCGETRTFDLASALHLLPLWGLLGKNRNEEGSRKSRASVPKSRWPASGPALPDPADWTPEWRVGVISAPPQRLSGYLALHPAILVFHQIPNPITHPQRHTNLCGYTGTQTYTHAHAHTLWGGLLPAWPAWPQIWQWELWQPRICQSP